MGKYRHTRAGYREISAEMNVLLNRIKAIQAFMESFPESDDFARTMAEDSCVELQAAADAVSTCAQLFYR